MGIGIITTLIEQLFMKKKIVQLICYDTETGDQIESDETLLKYYNIFKYSINDNGSLNVFEGVSLYNKDLNFLPFKFHYIGGSFTCTYNNLTDLKGSPSYVGGYFYCRYNNLTNLEGGPSYVGGNFYCASNNLTSLKGAPDYVGGDFSCHSNNLTDFRKSFIEGYWY